METSKANIAFHNCDISRCRTSGAGYLFADLRRAPKLPPDRKDQIALLARLDALYAPRVRPWYVRTETVAMKHFEELELVERGFPAVMATWTSRNSCYAPTPEVFRELCETVGVSMADAASPFTANWTVLQKAALRDQPADLRPYVLKGCFTAAMVHEARRDVDRANERIRHIKADARKAALSMMMTTEATLDHAVASVLTVGNGLPLGMADWAAPSVWSGQDWEDSMTNAVAVGNAVGVSHDSYAKGPQSFWRIVRHLINRQHAIGDLEICYAVDPSMSATMRLADVEDIARTVRDARNELKAVNCKAITIVTDRAKAIRMSLKAFMKQVRDMEKVVTTFPEVSANVLVDITPERSANFEFMETFIPEFDACARHIGVSFETLWLALDSKKSGRACGMLSALKTLLPGPSTMSQVYARLRALIEPDKTARAVSVFEALLKIKYPKSLVRVNQDYHTNGITVHASSGFNMLDDEARSFITVDANEWMRQYATRGVNGEYTYTARLRRYLDDGGDPAKIPRVLLEANGRGVKLGLQRSC